MIQYAYRVAFLHLKTHAHWTNLVMLYETGKSFYDNLWGQAEPDKVIGKVKWKVMLISSSSVEVNQNATQITW